MSSLSLLNTQQRGVLVYHMGPRIFFLPKPYAVRSMPEKQFWAPVMRWLPFDVFGTGYAVEGLTYRRSLFGHDFLTQTGVLNK